MKIIEIDYPRFFLEHRGKKFDVVAARKGDGMVIFKPSIGWNNLTSSVGQDSESLYEEIDDVIYNAWPELWEVANDDR